MAFQMVIRMFVRSPIMFVFAIIMVARNGGSLMFTYIVAIPVLALGIYLMMSNAHPRFEKAFKSYDNLNRVVGENLNGIRTVKAYVREERETEKFDQSATEIYDNFVSAQKVMALSQPMMSSVMYLCIIAVSFIGAKLINAGNMTTGQLMSVFTYNGQILMSLIMIGMFMVMVTIARASAERIMEVLETDPDMDINTDGETEVKDGSIEFDNVSFAYKKGADVLENINLKIESGMMVGILGPTGSGKSTLISLIARLYDATGGSVKVGGKDVKEYNLKSLRDEVSVVLQKNQLFTGSVKDNLKWGNKDASDEEIWRACDEAGASEFLHRFPSGLETDLGQGGVNVSGGQKQRLCIAKKPKVLIMDDSTSAVDTQTDSQIRYALKNDIRDVTKIIIAQRISSVQDADMIVMLNDGRIEDVGTHDELLSRNANYQGLFNTQAKAKEA